MLAADSKNTFFKLHFVPPFHTQGQMGFCTRHSGTSSLPTPCIKVSQIFEIHLWFSFLNHQHFFHLKHTGFVQCLQCYYQSGCLYRLRALGERHNMDLTVGEIHRPRTQNTDELSQTQHN